MVLSIHPFWVTNSTGETCSSQSDTDELAGVWCELLLMAEIWRSPPGINCQNPINHGINYQPQLVSRISAINSMGVSKNRGTPKSSILIGFPLINHPFWDTPIFGNTRINLGWGNPAGLAISLWDLPVRWVQWRSMPCLFPVEVNFFLRRVDIKFLFSYIYIYFFFVCVATMFFGFGCFFINLFLAWWTFGWLIFLGMKKDVPEKTTPDGTPRVYGIGWKAHFSPQKQKLPSLKLTWHLKIIPWKRRFLLETIIFRGYVSFRRECRWWQLKYFWNFHPETWGNDPCWLSYFWNGLKPPTRNGLLTNHLRMIWDLSEQLKKTWLF